MIKVPPIMVNNGSSSSSSEDASTLLQSVVDYVKYTQAKCLYLQRMPKDFLEGVDVQPILDFLVDSEVTEVRFSSSSMGSKLLDFIQVLPETKIEKLELDIINFDDILSLSAILKDTQITDLTIEFGHPTVLDSYCLLNGLVNHLRDTCLRSLKIKGLTTLGTNPKLVFSQILSKTHITHLHLQYSGSYESVYDFPESALNLQFGSLVDLNLLRASLDDSMVKAIGSALENSILDRLSLRYNDLTDVSVDFLLPGLIKSKVSYLDLSWNKINGKNTLLHRLKNTKIRILNLSWNPLSHDEIFADPRFLRGSAVVALELQESFKASVETASSTRILPFAFLRNFQFLDLTYLNLGWNNLESTEIEALAGILSHTNLTHINLSRNQFSERCYSVLGAGIRRSKVKYIDLSHSASSLESPEKARGIASFLDLTKGSALVSAHLGGNSKLKAFDIIVPTLENLTLLELDLAFTSFEPPPNSAIASLAQQLKMTTITALNLTSNDLEDDDAVILAKYIEETQVVTLDLSGNKIKCRGAKALASALKRTKLRSLDLGYNHIGNEGSESLAEHAANSGVTFLEVDCNEGGADPTPVDCVIWENRKKVQQLADLLKQSSTGKSCLLDFDHDFNDNQPDAVSFVENCFKICRFVSKEPYIVAAIEQDKLILDLRKQAYPEYHPPEYRHPLYRDHISYIEDCQLIYEKIIKQPSPVQLAVGQNKDVSFFKKQALWFILEYFPTKLASISRRAKVLFEDFKKN